MKRDLSFKPTKEIIEAVVFKVKIRNSEFIFDDIESAELFKNGYEQGVKNRKAESTNKSYKQGHQEGFNESAKGSIKGFCEYSQP